MSRSIADLKRGEHAIVKSYRTKDVPLKLLEMGCLPGNRVEMLQTAPFRDPIYLDINGSHLAIRRETALKILIEQA